MYLFLQAVWKQDSHKMDNQNWFCTALLFHVLSSTVFVVWCVLWTVFGGGICVLWCCFMSCLLRFLLFYVFYGVYVGGVSVFSDVVLSFLILLGFLMVILIMIHLLPSMNVSLFLFVNSEPVVIASCHRVIAFAAFEGYRWKAMNICIARER